MSYLLYCLFRSLPRPESDAAGGVDAQPVSVMDYSGLGAAVSELREADSHSDVTNVLAYESVVESFFRSRTIIPMRYGCAVPDRPGLAAVLDKHRQECDALLHRLEGLAEMGIQVPAGDCEADVDLSIAAIPPTRFHDSNRSGASYLFAKKLHYRGADRKVEQQSELAQAVCRPLAGLFVERKVELPSRRASFLSLYFLVPRASVEAFREASRQALQDEFRNLRVSGPWAPYNFAAFSDGGGIS